MPEQDITRSINDAYDGNFKPEGWGRPIAHFNRLSSIA
jgi:hypothetical protein